MFDTIHFPVASWWQILLAKTFGKEFTVEERSRTSYNVVKLHGYHWRGKQFIDQLIMVSRKEELDVE